MNDKSQFGEVRAGDNLATGGAKYDAGKPEVFQGVFDYFPRALLEVANVSGYGAAKYSWGGQKSVPDAYVRYGNSLGRHQMLAGIDGPYDIGVGGSGLLHDAQVAWNALAKLEVGLRDGLYKSTRGYPIMKKGPATNEANGTADKVKAADPVAVAAESTNFSQFEREYTKAQPEEGPSDAQMAALFEGLLRHITGGDIKVITDPREFYRQTGEWPSGLKQTPEDAAWIADFDFFGGDQWEVTAKGLSALKAPNYTKTDVVPSQFRPIKQRARPKAAAKKRKPAARVPARKR